ncbi:hypothetical protein T4B_5022 [Trichinella pseudospiralis]|uniref:Uncharacterized protein n=1 Tax=Trichinella pseudospiralis TaxID=6337 RepID=A0A0V1IJU4_TRIPS|nr:hypothetical protein T4A_4817 [Trichinella pseudospiralis]KRZ23055.1 hypothetical protein T4B_5022 [Trichinella pseudospiralis]
MLISEWFKMFHQACLMFTRFIFCLNQISKTLAILCIYLLNISKNVFECKKKEFNSHLNMQNT